MHPKPRHLGPEYAAQFGDQAVVDAYAHRPPYPPETFAILRALVRGPLRVLDAGCGAGDIARGLATHVECVDAVDIAPAMVDRGRQLPGGAHAAIRWHVGAMEDVLLDPPYGLITAGESLHWMEWSVVLPRFHRAQAPGAFLAIIGRHEHPNPWSDELLRLIQRYSTNRDYQPYNLLGELTSRGLFEMLGRQDTEPASFRQSWRDYVESIHSRNGFSRDRMLPRDAAGFDEAATRLIDPWLRDGAVELAITAHLVWGFPAAG